VCISIVLAFFNVFFNNLLTNLRFLTKMKCVTFGLCFYDCLNYVICAFCLNRLCRDRCFTPWTLGKWVIKAAIIGYTIHTVIDKKEQWDEDIEVGSLIVNNASSSNLDTYLIVYLLQHPIFMLSRIPIFFVYSILTCCCDKGEELDEADEFKDRILSFDYIDHELPRVDNFRNHPVGMRELEFNMALSIVRRNSVRDIQAANANNENRPSRSNSLW